MDNEILNDEPNCKPYHMSEYEWNELLTYVPNIEAFNRKLIKSKIADKEACEMILSELPTKEWFKLQRIYYNNLSLKYNSYINFYTYKGDVLLNNFIRNNFIVTEDMISFINDSFYYIDYMIETYEYLEDFLIDYYNGINEIIKNAPVLDNDIVVYRGHLTKVINKGIISTSLNTSISIRFSFDELTKKHNYISRITIPKGTSCLYNSKLSEMEIMLPDNIILNETAPYTEHTYFREKGMFEKKNSYIENILTNELKLVKYDKTIIDKNIVKTKHEIKSLAPSPRLNYDVEELYNYVNLTYGDELKSLTLDKVITSLREIIKSGYYTDIPDYSTAVYEDLLYKETDENN
jgi:hypothetical protein